MMSLPRLFEHLFRFLGQQATGAASLYGVKERINILKDLLHVHLCPVRPGQTAAASRKRCRPMHFMEENGHLSLIFERQLLTRLVDLRHYAVLEDERHRHEDGHKHERSLVAVTHLGQRVSNWDASKVAQSKKEEFRCRWRQIVFDGGNWVLLLMKPEACVENHDIVLSRIKRIGHSWVIDAHKVPAIHPDLEQEPPLLDPLGHRLPMYGGDQGQPNIRFMPNNAMGFATAELHF